MKAKHIAILGLFVLIFTAFGIGIKLDGKITTGLGSKEESKEVDSNEKDDEAGESGDVNKNDGTSHGNTTGKARDNGTAGYDSKAEAKGAKQAAKSYSDDGTGANEKPAESAAKPDMNRADVEKLEEAARGLLVKEERTDDEKYTMLEHAYTALTNYNQIDQALSVQKMHVLLSRIHLELEAPGIALLHAREALKVKDANIKEDNMAYGFEVMARSYAALGDKEKAQKYVSFAEKTADQIRDEEKRDKFLEDFDKDPWYGVIAR